MKNRTRSVIVGLLTAGMLVFGLLLPNLVEAIAGGADSSPVTVAVEPLRFEGGGGSVFEILRRISDGGSDVNSVTLSTRELTEGYQYSQETARAHAKELLVNYLNDCGFKESAQYYAESFDSLKTNQEALIVAAADYPVPWSAMIWNVECYLGAEFTLLFDDASGTLLGCSLPLFEGVTFEDFSKKAMDRTDDCAKAFAEQLGGEITDWIDVDPLNSYFRVTGPDGDSARLNLTLYPSEEHTPVLLIYSSSSETWGTAETP